MCSLKPCAFCSAASHDDSFDGLQSFVVQNPWLNLPPESPYILGMDSECVNRYAESVGTGRKVNVESVPEPFIGNPQLAI
jgi:hypothetical protein